MIAFYLFIDWAISFNKGYWRSDISRAKESQAVLLITGFS